jgi:uncharacterized damage-inducible protein DinB
MKIAMLLCLLTTATLASAQENPLTGHGKLMYGGIKYMLLSAAEKMPEEHYGYKPAADVRSFGQIVGHAADAQYVFCSVVLGEKNPAPKIEQTKTSKADLVAALEDAIAYCDKAYSTLNDATGVQMVKAHGMDMPKLGVMTVSQLHSSLHYGNLVTYMRLKNIVPPSSEPDFGAKVMASMKR